MAQGSVEARNDISSLHVVCTRPSLYGTCLVHRDTGRVSLSKCRGDAALGRLVAEECPAEVVAYMPRLACPVDPSQTVLHEGREVAPLRWDTDQLEQLLVAAYGPVAGMSSLTIRFFGPHACETHAEEALALVQALHALRSAGELGLLAEPVIVADEMVLDQDALEQLDLLPLAKDFANACHTPQGARLALRTFAHPMTRRVAIDARLQRMRGSFPDSLRDVGDIERMVRRMRHPATIARRLEDVASMLAWLGRLPDLVPDLDEELLEDCNDAHARLSCIVDRLSPCGRGDLLSVCSKQAREYSALSDELKLWEKRCRMRSNVAGNNARIVDVGSEEGVHIACIKRKGMTATGITFVPMKVGMRASNAEIDDLCERLNHMRSHIEACTSEHLDTQVTAFLASACVSLYALSDVVAEVDMCAAAWRHARSWGWCVPELLDEDDNGCVDITGVRHPTVEQVAQAACVRNDVTIGCSSGPQGMVLHGVNSCGKSCLLKSVAICAVLAQTGLCVPAQAMKFRPFTRIITQVPCRDDVLRGRSSFVAEMQGLDAIVRNADCRTLVIADELTRGTENLSSHAVFAAAARCMQLSGARFIMSTHLRDLEGPMRACSVDFRALRICHLRCTGTPEGGLRFDRVLVDGKGPEDDYGVRVAMSIVQDRRFAVLAQAARTALMVAGPSGRQCSYDRGLWVSECQVCRAPAHETHHIVPQKLAEAGSGALPGGGHKDARSNLVHLCKSCHHDVHAGRLQIGGWTAGTDGVKLQCSRQLQSVEKTNGHTPWSGAFVGR